MDTGKVVQQAIADPKYAEHLRKLALKAQLDGPNSDAHKELLDMFSTSPDALKQMQAASPGSVKRGCVGGFTGSNWFVAVDAALKGVTTGQCD